MKRYATFLRLLCLPAILVLAHYCELWKLSASWEIVRMQPTANGLIASTLSQLIPACALLLLAWFVILWRKPSLAVCLIYTLTGLYLMCASPFAVVLCGGLRVPGGISCLLSPLFYLAINPSAQILQFTVAGILVTGLLGLAVFALGREKTATDRLSIHSTAR